MKRLFNIIILSFMLSIGLIAQSGGTGTYKVLNSLVSARMSGMSVDFAPFYDNDIGLVVANPSLINRNMHTGVSLSYIDFFSNINMGYITYSHTFDKVGSFAASVQYVNYNKFKYANPSGVIEGEFTCNDVALTTGWGRELTPNWSIGANFKMIFSAMESYNSFGMAVDVAGTYRIPEKDFSVSLAARNIGAEIKSYAGTRSHMPFEIQLALSQKLKHLPFRYIILIQDMQKWNLSNAKPTSPSDYNTLEPESGEPRQKTKAAIFGDNLLRHIALGGEFTIAKIVYLRLGYNYQRGQELKIPDMRSLAGFSFGLGLDIYRFAISYSHSIYTLGGGQNYFSIRTKLSDWF